MQPRNLIRDKDEERLAGQRDGQTANGKWASKGEGQGNWKRGTEKEISKAEGVRGGGKRDMKSRIK